VPITYVCRKCGRNHSKEEYIQCRFCQTCGSFLLPTFKKEDQRFQTPVAIQASNNSPKEKFALSRAAESLRQRVGHSKEYEIVPETQREQPKAPGFESWLWSHDFDEALKLEKEVIKQYKGKTLEDALPGKVVSNEQGECYSIATSCTSTFKTVSYEESRRVIISDLKVLPGIGPVSEQLLKQQGYETVEDLERHPRWKALACQYMKLIDNREVEPTQKWLWQRLPKSHPLLHYLAVFCQNQDFAIVDIETLGLSERPIILLGIAKPSKDYICTSQYLLRDIQDEPSAIWALVSQLEPNLSLITFNGRSFDIPYIKQRLAYYGLDAPLDNPHFDVLHFTRRALKNKLPDCRLDTVEQEYLGVKREVNIPGALVPHFYDSYLRTKNVGPLVPIVEHNKQDLLTLGTLFSKLYEEWNLDR
jgi:uncharacterized protein YprB with RNaseH-like and TPR domain/DNA-directed RNA polymerase subunit RPC12/RpoP